jgi:putative MATE family efflux protein
MEPISTLNIWRLTWPTIISNIVYMLMMVAFLKIAGTFGTDAVAAVTTGQRLYFILHAVMMGLCAGTTAVVGKYWGGNNKILAGRFAALSVFLFFIDGLLLAWLAIPFREQLVGIFGLSEGAHLLAIDFVLWTAVFAPAMLTTLVFNMAFRATGDSTTPLWSAIVGVTLSLALGIAMTFGWVGLEARGVSGLAIGGGIAMTITIIIFLLIWIFGGFRFKPTNPLPDLVSNGKVLLNIGLPAAFEQAFFQGGLLIFMVFLAGYGSAPFAAYGIGLSILGIVIVVAFSFSISSATLVSQHLGAGDLAGAYQAGWKTMRTSLYIMITGGMLMSWFAEEIARFMINDPQVIFHMVQFTYILSACLPMIAIEFTMAGALRGAGDTRYPMMVTVFSILLTRIMAPWVLVSIGADVVWLYATSLVDFSIKSSLNMRRFRKKGWFKGHQHIIVG